MGIKNKPVIIKPDKQPNENNNIAIPIVCARFCKLINMILFANTTPKPTKKEGKKAIIIENKK